MSSVLGIDTSNYTTSLALWDSKTATVRQEKQLLPVKEGAMGLRQSDAVFHHTCQLPQLMEKLCADSTLSPACIGVSVAPTEQDGSYMPCFLAGEGLARSLSATLQVPLFRVTHQQGHVAAACLGADCVALLDKPFLAFHVSGGTTDALYVTPTDDGGISCRLVAHSLDLKAGQLIDRVGGRLGLRFPAGPALDKLATASTATFRCRPSMDGANCHLSGVENQCEQHIKNGMPSADVARFCLYSIEAALVAMTDKILEKYGCLPLVFAGGVMSNSLLREHLQARYGAYFAPPAFSADNAAGVALLAARKYERKGEV
ncbi:MAG: peptidase M22 [Clostridia bacterium]|nr:peptidase M22 [Clostridia bacterium]